MKNKCVFLDRDGVINVDNVNYTYKVEEFKIIDGVIPALKMLKDAGYLLIIITNQSGIAKGIYQHDDVYKCHGYFDKESGNLIDEYFYSPYHQSTSESLSRKPGSLMFEKAIAKYDIDLAHSWMVGDRERDIIPANNLNIPTILIEEFPNTETSAKYKVDSLFEAAELILKSNR
ncbi:D-glycero-alpha-D-manno-heptose-1,7-bisphosphate 7-phosphatase [Cytophaga aurantiaca]|uniref:D-glycero-alpha-D-manno-heptose-1,7-bisphosphate 7-phosphatase n=1 Tax=Cytophaga aurantiaca TaxID=29530 RepID=UPI00036D07D7|nr:HAD family hydrolase [Cytophaga aurantiaca]